MMMILFYALFLSLHKKDDFYKRRQKKLSQLIGFQVGLSRRKWDEPNSTKVGKEYINSLDTVYLDSV